MRKKQKGKLTYKTVMAQLLSKFLRERTRTNIRDSKTRKGWTDSPHSYFGVQFNWKQLWGEKRLQISEDKQDQFIFVYNSEPKFYWSLF